MYKHKRTTLVKTSMSFNFVHWPIQNLFKDEIFPIYSISKNDQLSCDPSKDSYKPASNRKDVIT